MLGKNNGVIAHLLLEQPSMIAVHRSGVCSRQLHGNMGPCIVVFHKREDFLVLTMLLIIWHTDKDSLECSFCTSVTISLSCLNITCTRTNFFEFFTIFFIFLIPSVPTGICWCVRVCSILNSDTNRFITCNFLLKLFRHFLHVHSQCWHSPKTMTAELALYFGNFTNCPHCPSNFILSIGLMTILYSWTELHFWSQIQLTTDLSCSNNQHTSENSHWVPVLISSPKHIHNFGHHSTGLPPWLGGEKDLYHLRIKKKPHWLFFL